MKTIITTAGCNVSSQLDKRFGRAAWFCLYDEETRDATFFENVNVSANNGAGTMVAKRMVEIGVGKVISADFGHKAKECLDNFNIQMVIIKEDEITVDDIIQKLEQ